MTKIEFDDMIEIREIEADHRGRVSLGKNRYANKTVKFIIVEARDNAGDSSE